MEMAAFKMDLIHNKQNMASLLRIKLLLEFILIWRKELLVFQIMVKI